MHHRTPTPSLSLEQQWSDEVHYLHFLWRQGPPNQNPNPTTPKPTPTPPTLAPSSSIKKKKKKKTPLPKPPPDTEWPLNSPIAEDPRPWTEIGWPEPAPKPAVTPVSVDEQKRFAAVQLQKKSVRACQDFFSRSTNNSDPEVEVEAEEEDDDDSSSEEEDESDAEEEDEDEDEDDEDQDGTEALEFFLGVFKQDNELRDYYEKNYENGEFCCLVCGGIGQKVGKRYKNCVGLVQHAVAISKTKKKNAHRAFGKAVCKVLGWDIKRLPSIVLSMDDPLGSHLAKPDSAVLVGEQKRIAAVQLHQESVKVCQDFFSKNNDNFSPKRIAAVQLHQKSVMACQDLFSRNNENSSPKRIAAVQLHQKSVKACQDFFSRDNENLNSGPDEEDTSDEDEGEDGDSMEEDRDEYGNESEELEFFLGIFKKDDELRNYYEKNLGSGEFCCLVCGGSGKKVGKRFKNCFALVQHSVAISKKNQRGAHLAFGKAICQVLGWDINQLPGIVPYLDDPLGCRLVKPDSAGNSEGADDSTMEAEHLNIRSKVGDPVVFEVSDDEEDLDNPV